MLELPVDLTDEIKVRFLSCIPRGKTRAYHAKAGISSMASFDRVVQAFATSIHDRAELEVGRTIKSTYVRKGTCQMSELSATGKNEQSPSNPNRGNSDG